MKIIEMLSELVMPSHVTQGLEVVIAHLLENYEHDHDAKDAAIDSIIQYLQTLKTKKEIANG